MRFPPSQRSNVTLKSNVLPYLRREENHVLIIGKDLDNFPRLFNLFCIFLLLVSLHVFEEVIRSDERSAASGANELLLSSMRSLVTRQLITAGKDLVAVRVRTIERFLTSMDSVVCLEMGQLVVRFVTPRVGAAEGFLSGGSLARRSVGCKARLRDDK